jgi:DNA-binding NtrC family response regulator
MASERLHPENNVHALRPPRVLIAVADRRFVRVVGFLIARRGLVVESTPKPSDVLDIVDRERPDVVVLDGVGSLAQAARTAAAIEALHDHVNVLVVTDEDAYNADGLRLFPKWGAVESLVEAIAAAGFGQAAPAVRPLG